MGVLTNPWPVPGDTTYPAKTTDVIAEVDEILADQNARLDLSQGRARLSLFADFSDYPNGRPDGISAEFAPHPWLTTGAVFPEVVDGVLTTNGSGYLYTTIDPTMFAMGMDAHFGGSGSSSCLTLALCRSETNLLNNFVHCIIGPGGWNMTIREDGGPFEAVNSGGWDEPLKLDGTVYRFGLARYGDTLIIIGPNGEQSAINDYRVAEVFDGNQGTAFWQAPSSGATKGYIHRVWTYSREVERYPNFADFMGGGHIPGLAIDPEQGPGVTAGYGYPGQVYIGPISGNPGIKFGGYQYKAIGKLSAAMSIGDTTFVTDRVVLGTVTIGIGNDAEAFTVSGYPTGTGPFTHTVTVPATKAHPLGQGYVGRAGTATQSIYVSLGNKFMYMPPQLALESGTYIGTDLTSRLSGSDNTITVAPGDVFKMQSGNTASRPSRTAGQAGSLYFDTTLGKLIIWNGTAWVDVNGGAL